MSADRDARLRRTPGGRGGLDVVLGLLAVAGVAVLTFLAGSWLTWKERPPFRPMLRDAFLALDAFLPGSGPAPGDRDIPPNPDPWARPKGERRSEPRGVLALDPLRAAPGLTLVVVGQSAHLVELDGTVRHTWRLDYESIRGAGAVLEGERHPTHLYWRPARAFPDGDLLAIVDVWETTPFGLALVRLDRDSNVRWVHHGHVHHDFDVAPDGRIFVLAQEVRRNPPRRLPYVQGPVLEELLLVLTPEGRLERRISLLEAFANSPWHVFANEIAGLARYKKGDYLHSNNVDIVDAVEAARAGWAREGQVLLSFREMDSLALLDVEAGRIAWARRGEWHRQHDPDITAAGTLLIFDNQGDWRRGGRTRIIDYDPRTSAIVWEYPGEKGRDIWSAYRGELQEMPNGNVLLNEFMAGRLLEVTRGGETVWEYRCPFAYPGDEELVCRVMHFERYPEGTFSFGFNEGRLPAVPGAGGANAPRQGEQ